MSSLTLGWEFLAAVLGLQLAAEPVRYLLRSRLAQARRIGEVRRDVRARYRTQVRETRGDRDVIYRLARINWRRAMRSLRRAQLARLGVAAGLWAGLFANWFGFHAFVASTTINSARGGLPDEIYVAPKVGLCMIVALLTVMLAALMTRDGEWAARPRALVYVMACAAITLFLDEYGKDTRAGPETVALALVSLSPAAWQVISRLIFPAALRPAGPRRRTWDVAIPELTWPTTHARAVQPVPPVTRPEAAPKRAEPQPTSPPRGPASVQPRPLPVVAADQLELGDVLHSRYPHICWATNSGFEGRLVLKQFTQSDPAGRAINPQRPLLPYLEQMSRINQLPPDERSLAGRVLLWPVAVVEGNGMAAGVLIPPMGGAFLDDEVGGIRLADHLFEKRHGFTAGSRAQVLLDIVVAHRLMHRMGLAHGDTSLRNVALALPPRAGGVVFDADGATDFNDPAPRLITQALWDLPDDLDPEHRDLARLALLVARVAADQLDAEGLPAHGPSWLTPQLRKMVGRSLADPGTAVSAAELIRAIADGMRVPVP